ncbi:MAG: glycosyltransferase family 1 protein [Candidatus Doudnabacteria bacterium]|nr:glycosyltransferase family 1 protein [Candidatus Doudnabacteria bacterium]
MKIAIDLRSLSSGSISGVENYIVNLLEHLLPLDNKNTYSLFYNAWGQQTPGEFNFVNSQIIKTRIPNKILNALLLTNLVKMEKLAGELDLLFLPNLNQFSILPHTKLAITVHDLSPVITPEFYDLKRRVWHKFLNYKRAFDRADIIFAVSEYTKRDIIRIFNINEGKIKIVYPGVDHNIFHQDLGNSQLRRIRNIYGLPGDYILFLNTIEPRKNLSGLLKAYGSLDSRADLVIVGRRGWKHKRIFKEIKNSKKSAKIRYIGYVNETDKPGIIKLARLLVYPSFYEGFGFQPLEAMSLGVPAIVSQVTSLPEVVGDAALLVNPYNVDDIRQGIWQLLTDENLRRRFIEKGLEKAKQYNWRITAEKTLEGLNTI